MGGYNEKDPTAQLATQMAKKAFTTFPIITPPPIHFIDHIAYALIMVAIP